MTEILLYQRCVRCDRYPCGCPSPENRILDEDPTVTKEETEAAEAFFAEILRAIRASDSPWV